MFTRFYKRTLVAAVALTAAFSVSSAWASTKKKESFVDRFYAKVTAINEAEPSLPIGLPTEHVALGLSAPKLKDVKDASVYNMPVPGALAQWLGKGYQVLPVQEDTIITNERLAERIVEAAINYLGVPYRWGGARPQTGFDCSGFIWYVARQYLGVNIPRQTWFLWKVGARVYMDELQPGDLVFFNTRGRAHSHVGIYIGNGEFIHAPRTGKDVMISNLRKSHYWSTHFDGARRITQSINYARNDSLFR